MTEVHMYASGAELKESGNDAFKAGNLEAALMFYDKASAAFREPAASPCALCTPLAL